MLPAFLVFKTSLNLILSFINFLRMCYYVIRRASPGAAVKLCLGDLLVMGSNPKTVSLHMQG